MSIMAIYANFVSSQIRLNIQTRNAANTATRLVTGTSAAIAINTRGLISVEFDWVAGVARILVGNTVYLTDAAAFTATTILSTTSFVFMSRRDNNTTEISGNTAGAFFTQGFKSAAQLQAIRTELLQTYIL